MSSTPERRGSTTPHYLLFSECGHALEPGRWRFVLRSSDGRQRLVADDIEPDARGDRLELLAIVRGLEALDRPCRVTLMTGSLYVREGIRRGLAEWRTNDWQWEHFGQMKPVRHRDLWERIDRAAKIHEIDCRTWRIDAPHEPATPAAHAKPVETPRPESKPQPTRWPSLAVPRRVLAALERARSWLRLGDRPLVPNTCRP